MSRRLKMRVWKDPILRGKSLPVDRITPELCEFVDDMITTCDLERGIGLAAVQVGSPIRLFILRDYVSLPDGSVGFSEPKVFINPSIVSQSEETYEDNEGCLSIPGLSTGPVKRAVSITVRATDLHGKEFTEERIWENARVFLHEYDHLEGVLYIDYLPVEQKKAIQSHLDKLEKQYINSSK